MSEPFLAEIKAFGFNFAPPGWAQCDGQILLINQNQSLYSLLGTTFGGDGEISFGLPELRGRAPVHPGSDVGYGQRGGEQDVTLSALQMPQHSHNLAVNTADAVNGDSPAANTVIGKAGVDMFAAPGTLGAMSAISVGNAGSTQSHTNMQPCLTLNFCIALQGLFPSE